jgi:hypothetical protein
LHDNGGHAPDLNAVHSCQGIRILQNIAVIPSAVKDL